MAAFYADALPESALGLKGRAMKRIHWHLQWAKRNPLFWANLAIAGLLASLIWHSTSDLHVRALGVILELIGVATVWSDLTRSAKKAGRGGVVRGTLDWLRQGVRGRTTHIAAGTLSGGWSILGGRASLRRGVSEEADLAMRVSALEQNLAALDRELGQTHDQVQRIETETKRAIEQEKEARKTSFEKLQSDLTDYASGSYATLLFGVVWLCVGMVLSGFSGEVLWLIQLSRT